MEKHDRPHVEMGTGPDLQQEEWMDRRVLTIFAESGGRVENRERTRYLACFEKTFTF